MNDIDLLMSRVDEINSRDLTTDPLSSSDIDTIIAFHRANRSRKATGTKAAQRRADLTNPVTRAEIDAFFGAKPKAPSLTGFKLK